MGLGIPEGGKEEGWVGRLVDGMDWGHGAGVLWGSGKGLGD